MLIPLDAYCQDLDTFDAWVHNKFLSEDFGQISRQERKFDKWSRPLKQFFQSFLICVLFCSPVSKIVLLC